MITSHNQFNIGIDGSYQATEALKGSIIKSSDWQRSQGASLLRGR